jgi:CheY-like chemotaxis protein
MNKIILIDDVADICEALSMLLQMNFSQVVIDVAYNGLEGLNFIKQNKYDIIITDLDMPVLTGGEMITQIKSLNLEHGKIYIMSGNFENQNKQLQYDRYFTKPMNLKKLIEDIRNDLK